MIDAIWGPAHGAIIPGFVVRRLSRWCLFFSLCASVGAQDEDAPVVPGDRILVRVRFEGNRRYTDEFLKEQIASKEGQAYDSGLITQDERVLRQYFSAVLDTLENEVEGGVEIVFVVLDKVVVGKVRYVGLKRVKVKDFEALVSTRPGRPLLQHSIDADKELIERLHRQKGYRFVHVIARRLPTRKPDVEDIVFQLLAGPRVKVREVILEGAHSIRKSELQEIIRNSDRYRKQFLGLGAIFNPTYYDRAAIDQDRRRMEVYYDRMGWRDAKVVYVDTRFENKRKYAFIRYRIDEGQRYRVRSFTVEYAEGGEPQPEDRQFLSVEALVNLSVLEFQQPYRSDDLSKTRQLINGRLWDRAYARSKIVEVIHDDPNKHVVDVKLVISAGEKVRQGRLKLFGNKYTKDNVIRRQFRQGALPGDELNIESLEAGRNRLGNLRYFGMVRFGDGRDPWGLTKDPNTLAEDVWDVELEVEETDTRQFSIGAGVSTDGGAFGQFSVTWRNFDIGKPPPNLWKTFDQTAFRGAGQRFTLSAAPGTTFSTFNLSFVDPALNDSRWSLNTSLFSRIAVFDEYTTTQTGLAVTVGRFLDEEFIYNLAIDWSLREVLLDDPRTDTPVNALDQQGYASLHGIGFTLTRRRTREADAFLNGHVSSLSASVFGLGFDVQILKANIQHRAGWRLWNSSKGWHRVRVNFGLYWAAPFGNTSEVPIYERYFLGGRNMRGFEFREVGPKSNGSPTGGDVMATISIQYTFPVVNRGEAGFGLDLVFFVDQGTLVENPGDFNSGLWRMAVGFGVGVGFGSAVQPPLIIDFGWPVLSQPGDKTQVVSVAFERNF